MKHSFSIVHPQGTHVNITKVSCEKLDLDSSGTHVCEIFDARCYSWRTFVLIWISNQRHLIDCYMYIICPRYEKEVTTFNIFPPIVILCALPAFLESMYMTLDFEGLNSMSWLQPYV